MNHTAVHDFWNAASCGEALLLAAEDRVSYDAQSAERYRLEPYISEFAGFNRVSAKHVLEVGVGLGADHQCFAEGGAVLSGVDLTERAVRHTKQRLQLAGLPTGDLRVAAAENLPFHEGSFDHVYSWGVIHHAPDTQQCAAEILRVLKPGGTFAVMIYNRYSIVGFMLWARYGFGSLDRTYSMRLESPGTKAFTPRQAAALFPGAVNVRIKIELTHGDLLSSGAGQRHQGRLLDLARKVWPRWIIKRFGRKNGLFLSISGEKPA